MDELEAEESVELDLREELRDFLLRLSLRFEPFCALRFLRFRSAFWTANV